MLDPKKVRDKRGKRRQRVVAAQAKISPMTLSQIENPSALIDPSLSTVENLAKAFGCSILELLSDGRPEDRAKVIIERVLGRPVGMRDGKPRTRGPNKKDLEESLPAKRKRKPRL